MGVNKKIKQKFTHIKIRTFHLITTGISMIILGLVVFLVLNFIFNIFASQIAQTASQGVADLSLSEDVHRMVNDAASQISPGLTINIITVIIFAMVVYYIFLDVLNINLIIHPLENIAKKANQIAKDRTKLGEQIDPPIFKEMQDVTDAFNKMSVELETQMNHLEKEVDLRTRELEITKENIEHLAYHDELTSLPNRRLFNEYADQAIKQAHRKNTKFALLMIDLDQFKKINDTHGHLMGDKVLQGTAQKFKHALRESDLISRWGGDEFSILLFDTVNKSDVIKVITRIFTVFNDPIQINRQRFFIQMSIGATLYPNHGENLQSLLQNADTALYQAKQRCDPRSFQFFKKSIALPGSEKK